MRSMARQLIAAMSSGRWRGCRDLPQSGHRDRRRLVSEPSTFGLLLSHCSRRLAARRRRKSTCSAVVAQGDTGPWPETAKRWTTSSGSSSAARRSMPSADLSFDTGGKTLADAYLELRASVLKRIPAGRPKMQLSTYSRHTNCTIMHVAGRCRVSDEPQVDYRTDPPATSIGSSASMARWRRWRSTSPRTAACRSGYKLKLNSYDLGVDIELHDAVQRIRFEHPEVRCVDRNEREGPRLLLGRQHLHARPVEPRVEGELLQVHQRDAQRASRTRAAIPGSSSSPPSTAPAPAAAMSWRSPATRSYLVDDRSSSGLAA